MKVQVLNIQGEKVKEISTGIFEGKIREDIVQKVIEAEKKQHPYAPFWRAGNQYASSGKATHRRHVWKTATGKGLSKIPRKIFRRRGSQFLWEGATIPSTRGGRRAHPPKIAGFLNEKKINKKEKELAFKSALASLASMKMVKEKYQTLHNKEIKIKLPVIIESKSLSAGTKEFISGIKTILGELSEVAFKKKNQRAGRGKMRGRKYKQTAGMILIIGNKEEKKNNSIEIKKIKEVTIRDIAEGGARVSIFTEKAIEELGNKINKKIKEKEK